MDNQVIRNEIEVMLEKSTFVLTKFDYNHMEFGNIIAELYNGNKRYRFVTDRGEIWCDEQLVYLSDYHVAGIDDTPVYLMKAIQRLLDEKKANIEQCLPVTQYILSKLADLVDRYQVCLSADSIEYKGKTQRFDSVFLDKENKISFDVYDNDDVWVFYLEYDHYMMKMEDNTTFGPADTAANTLREVLTCPIKVVKIYKGKKLRKQILYFLEDNQWIKSGTISYSLVRLFNPFDKRTVEEIFYDFKK